MRLSVIIPYAASNEKYRAHSYELVCAQWQAMGADVEILTEPGIQPFNLSTARNLGARRARHEVLAFVDADTVFTDPRWIHAAYDFVRRHEFAWAFPHGVYWTAEPHFTDAWYAAGPAPIGAPGTFSHRLVDNLSGILFVTQTAFGRVRGYDERFRGWGYEDNAFAASLETLVGPPARFPGELIHLWHPREKNANGWQSDFAHPHITHNQSVWALYERAQGHPMRMRSVIEAR